MIREGLATGISCIAQAVAIAIVLWALAGFPR
jgi:hypothetical protein